MRLVKLKDLSGVGVIVSVLTPLVTLAFHIWKRMEIGS